MHFKDAFRAQYFMAHLENKIAELEVAFASCSTLFYPSIQDVLSDFITNLSEELDQIILPSFVYAFSKAKAEGNLNGDTAFDRYDSFFIKNGRYSSEA